MAKGQIVGLADHTLLIAKDGHEYPIADSGAPIRHADGHIIGVAMVFRDVTRAYAQEQKIRENENLLEYDDQRLSVAFVQDISSRKQTEKEASRLGAALLQAQKMEAIGTLAGGIAHDFNNILSGVIGYSELSLSMTEKDSPVHQNLQEVVTAGLRARDLVRQILTFSRKDERELTPLQAGPLIKETLKLLRSSLPTTIDISQEIVSNMDNVLAETDEDHDLPCGSEHILLVDDEPTVLDVGRLLLENLGYRVSTASGSHPALELFRQAPHAVDLVLTDMTMPKMTGDQLAVELLKIRPDLPIILSTGYSVNINSEKALKMGIKAFISKPVVETDLAGIVRNVLDGTNSIS